MVVAMVGRAVLVAALAVLLACGGETSGDDASTDATASDASTDNLFNVDVHEEAWTKPDAMSPDAAYTPTCNDVGKYVGTATCCDGGYCSGYCTSGKYCACENTQGGCPWPLVCCFKPGGCISADLCQEWQ